MANITGKTSQYLNFLDENIWNSIIISSNYVPELSNDTTAAPVHVKMTPYRRQALSEPMPPGLPSHKKFKPRWVNRFKEQGKHLVKWLDITYIHMCVCLESICVFRCIYVFLRYHMIWAPRCLKSQKVYLLFNSWLNPATTKTSNLLSTGPLWWESTCLLRSPSHRASNA